MAQDECRAKISDQDVPLWIAMLREWNFFEDEIDWILWWLNDAYARQKLTPFVDEYIRQLNSLPEKIGVRPKRRKIGARSKTRGSTRFRAEVLERLRRMHPTDLRKPDWKSRCFLSRY